MFVDNAPGDPPLTPTLEPIAQVLPTVVTRDSVRQYTSLALREFEERRKLGGGGRVVSEATLRAEDDRPLGNIIKAHVPGLDVLQNARDGDQAASIPTNDPNDFFPKDLAGVEYHSAATVPVQFNRTASGCGTLLLWTRER